MSKLACLARRARGFSLIEVIVVLAIAGVLAAIALPPLSRMRTAAALQSGRAQVTAALAFAQASAIRWGRTTEVAFDTVADAIIVRVDTVRTMPAPPIVLREYPLGRDLGVGLASDRASICYNSRGVGTTTARCPGAGARVIIRTPAANADTLRINTAGRVWR